MRLRTIGLLAGLAVATPATSRLHSHHRDSTTLPVPVTPVRFWRAGGRLVTPSDLKGDYGEGGYSLDGRLEDVDLGTVIDGFRSWHFGVAGIGGSRAATSGLKIGEFSVSNCD